MHAMLFTLLKKYLKSIHYIESIDPQQLHFFFKFLSNILKNRNKWN